MCGKVDKVLEQGHASAQKMTLHDDQDKELAEMRARYARTGSYPCIKVITMILG